MLAYNHMLAIPSHTIDSSALKAFQLKREIPAHKNGIAADKRNKGRLQAKPLWKVCTL